jgi:hypothetical protein
MIKPIGASLILIFFLSSGSFADETIRGHYCYTYGDSESLKEARELTRTLAIRNAIESYSVFVEASTKVSNFSTSNDLIQMLSSGQLKNINVESHTEKDRTICDIVSAKVSPSEFGKAIKREVIKISKKVESVGIASNRCLKILSVKGEQGKYKGVDVKVVIKANNKCVMRSLQSIVFVDYFDANGEPYTGAKKEVSGYSELLATQVPLEKGEIRSITFEGFHNYKQGSYRVWLSAD